MNALTHRSFVLAPRNGARELESRSMMPTPFVLAEASFKECQLAHEFLNRRVRPRIEHAIAETAPAPTAQTFHGVFLRALAWMCTLRKLNEPADFQAIAVASRALFEIAVDVTILRFDPSANPPEKMAAWEDSAKLKSAHRVVEFFTNSGRALPSEYEPMQRFIRTGSARVQKSRAMFWVGRTGKPFHPDRWTGRSLDRDAAAAVAAFPKGEFDDFYATRYPGRCWNIHGSGLAGVRFIGEHEFPGLSALAFGDCTHFALITGELTLRQFSMWDAAVEAEFDDHRTDRILMAGKTAFDRKRC
jgi:hypothetical protein